MRRLTIHNPSTAGAHTPRFDELHDAEDLWAVVHPVPLEDWTKASRLATDAPRLVVRSGRPVSDAASSFASWSGDAWKQFDTEVEHLIEAAPCPVLLWPGPGSVLSDAVSTLSFARRQSAVGLLVDPAAWITASMHADAADHLDRFARALTGCETVRAVAVRPIPEAGLDTEAVAEAITPLLDRVGTLVEAPAWTVPV
ncbi:MAG: hypothetical protein LAT64_07040 [Phycisphaerales bacterium]|nr:hypothetical protein [Planctomycetota bacterium]MCH8508510.1 hypothetical protein [Phycisphaerales bacterium]